MHQGPATLSMLDGADFPVRGSRECQLAFIARFAALAPSTHNVQPWIFSVFHQQLEIFANRNRSLLYCDPRDRELTISCGAALQFAWLSARNYGFETKVESFPDHSRPDLLARVSVEPGRGPSASEERRFRAIPQRRTNRRVFKPALPIHTGAVERLCGLAAAHDVQFRTLSDDRVIEDVAKLVARADRIQMADASCRRELANWIRRDHSREGMSLASFGLNERLSRPCSPSAPMAQI